MAMKMNPAPLFLPPFIGTIFSLFLVSLSSFRKYGGEEVYLCGSFSQWQIKKKMYKESEKG